MKNMSEENTERKDVHTSLKDEYSRILNFAKNRAKAKFTDVKTISDVGLDVFQLVGNPLTMRIIAGVMKQKLDKKEKLLVKIENEKKPVEKEKLEKELIVVSSFIKQVPLEKFTHYFLSYQKYEATKSSTSEAEELAQYLG